MAQEDFTSKNDPYVLLGVQPNATKKQIEEAYEKAKKRFTPEALKNLPPESRIAADKEATDLKRAVTLLTSDDREAFDQERRARRAAEAGAPDTTRVRSSTRGPSTTDSYYDYEHEDKKPEPAKTFEVPPAIIPGGITNLGPGMDKVIQGVTRVSPVNKVTSLAAGKVTNLLGFAGGPVTKIALTLFKTVAGKLLSLIAGKKADLKTWLQFGAAAGLLGGIIIASPVVVVGALFLGVAATASAAMIATVTLPFIAFFVLAPAVIALILFIINASAYVVPPSRDVQVREVPGDTACYRFDNTWDGSPDYLATAVQAVGTLVRDYPNFIAKVCIGNREVYLSYRPSEVLFGGYTPSADAIWLGNDAFSSTNAAIYTLAHESGHILFYRSTLFQSFADAPGLPQELPQTGSKKGIICTYPYDDGDPYWGSTESAIRYKKTFENFAEMIALYVAGDSPTSFVRSATCLSGGSLQSAYPLHWQFANTNIFN